MRCIVIERKHLNQINEILDKFGITTEAKITVAQNEHFMDLLFDVNFKGIDGVLKVTLTDETKKETAE